MPVIPEDSMRSYTSNTKTILIHYRCYWINVGSLICGFLGNLFLLLNFTQRIRYLYALPLTIIFWYLATGFVSKTDYWITS